MLIGQGGFVDADEPGRQHRFQIPQSLLNAIAVTLGIDSHHLSVQNGDALNLPKGQLPHLIFPITQNAVRTGVAAHQILDLLGQG